MPNPFLWLIHTLIWTYIYIIIAAIILWWLIHLSVVNGRNQFVAMIWDFLYRITEPVLAPIRRRMPYLGGVDISPFVLTIGLIFLDLLIFWLFERL